MRSAMQLQTPMFGFSQVRMHAPSGLCLGGMVRLLPQSLQSMTASVMHGQWQHVEGSQLRLTATRR